ncbi:TMV resistance protein N-like [Eucalyptus grandis]|uniref:TMV resistance protein N-like n=1 Tax=Eucalyptus grandis TaxID=71139 RepID=UPI00192EC1F3|nr:TMV resistance protein N-like [Eucalyptus grandis]
MANSETGTSTSNTSTSVYQVFLSFRGADTRRGFTSSLYHALIDAGIYVFIDDEELRPGETISGSLLQAINDSKLYIPIFSKDYASSHWCLRELAKMVENTSKSKEDRKKKVILPIFYNVEPKDVKLKTTLYNDAISNLEHKEEDQKKFSSEDIKMWRSALKEVAAMKGWELEKFPGHGDLIKLVVNEVVINLKTKERELTADLIGMKDRIATINNLLDIDSDVVRLIGIYGMGGIGTICNKKVLIVLDDVAEANQIQKLIGKQPLYPGTRILVTTRDKSVLNIKRFNYEFEKYEMVRLSEEEALMDYH